MYKYTQTEFVAMMDELMDKFKKGCQKSDAELEAALSTVWLKWTNIMVRICGK